MMKLWGRTSSVNVQKAVWILEESGAPYERIDAGMAFGIVKTPEYVAMNPNSLVPTLDDDGFVLWESNVIVRYVAAKLSPGVLYPEDVKRRAEAERWMDWQQTTFNPALGVAFWGLIRTAPELRNAAAIETALGKTAELAATFENMLANRPYVAGDAFTMGDIPMGASIHRWLHLPCDRPSIPNIEAWYKRLMQRPAAGKALPLTLS